MASKELAVISNFELALNNNVMTMLTENLGDDVQIPYDRIKFPSSGTVVFEVPTDDPDNPDTVKELEGVIICAPRSNAYWENAYDGSSTPPNCSSIDGKLGIDRETGELKDCADCPYNKYNSDRNGGKGKACKNMIRLFIMQSGSPMPAIFTLPPTSIKAYQDYAARLIIHKGLAPHHVITQITLTKQQNAGGITYSKAKFKTIGKVPDRMLPTVSEYHRSMLKASAGIRIDADDYCAAETETAVPSATYAETAAEPSNPVFEDAETKA